MFWKKPPEPPKSAIVKPTRDELIRQAKANVKAAREELGEETIARMREALLAQEQKKQAKPAAPPSPAKPAVRPPDDSPATRAKKLIETMDKAKVADYLRWMSREEKD